MKSPIKNVFRNCDKIRRKLRMKNFKLTGKKVENVKPSVVFNHLLKNDCSIDFNDFDILAADPSKFNHLIK